MIAIQWLTPAAFSLAERKTWAQFQEQSPSEEGQQPLEARISQAREREILAALSEGCEPRLHYPRIPIAEVMQKREGLRRTKCGGPGERQATSLLGTPGPTTIPPIGIPDHSQDLSGINTR